MRRLMRELFELENACKLPIISQLTSPPKAPPHSRPRPQTNVQRHAAWIALASFGPSIAQQSTLLNSKREDKKEMSAGRSTRISDGLPRLLSLSVLSSSEQR